MNEEERHALASVQFNWAVTPDDIWSPLDHHVDGLHQRAAEDITHAVAAAARKADANPTGIVLRGERGVGKTHLLGWLRQRVQQEGGAFFLLKLLDEHSFWAGAVHGVVGGLLTNDQLGRMLDKLAERTGHNHESRLRLRGTIPVARADVDGLIDRLYDIDPRVAVECQDTLRALVLYRAKGQPSEVGHGFLVLADGIDEADREAWGFRSRTRPAQLVLNDLSRIFALTGPVVMAVDQIDSVLTRPATGVDEVELADRLADGLMRLREETRRTILVVACIPGSWDLIANRGVNSAADRFRVLDLRTAMPSASVATAIVERHLAGLYGEIGFTPPYPTWPVLRSAFGADGIAHYTPRRLLQRVDDHVRRCLARDEVAELADFDAGEVDAAPTPVVPVDLGVLDERFARLCAAADVTAPLDHEWEDKLVPALLNAALRCYVVEQGDHGHDLSIDALPGGKPALHARLRRTLDEATEDEVHWSFRAIAHTHPNAVLTRLRSAYLEAGLRDGGNRHLVVLREAPFSGGPRTAQAVGEFQAAGGVVLPFADEDLRVFAALRTLIDESPAGLRAWLRARRPAGSSDLFTRVFPASTRRPSKARADLFQPEVPPAPKLSATSTGTNLRPVAVESADAHPEPAHPEPAHPAESTGFHPVPAEATGTGFRPVDPGAPLPRREPAKPMGFAPIPAESTGTRLTPVTPEPTAVEPAGSDGHRVDLADAGAPEPVLTFGASVATGTPFTVPLSALRKHVAVFAGSGSGKTVLLRRLIEEAALAGVSSIVIDTNNDLARLGDEWPAEPAGWGPGDADRAARYHADTEVVVWTPCRAAGRPLVLNPFPDFGGVLDDPDEFRMSVDASVSGLMPRTGLVGRRIDTGRAVLTQALTWYARRGGTDLAGFVEALTDLPDGVGTVRDATRLAADMADGLHAAMINDPVFGGVGDHVDPGVLLTPTPGRRARVSVISCVGLATDDQRRTFVNHLQLALFAWIRRHPAGDRPLGGLLVLDEAQTFVPSRGVTASTESSLRLATQARKYGLGLVYATQAPKALHNMVTGNAATQLFGRLNAAIQIQTALDLARAKGGRIDDISRLPAGVFHASTEGTGFVKVRAPMCLSHHPAGALTESEVVDRAATLRS
ncbi:hypothetical protein GCM10022243_29590 [Saccharothrix violaceirubra]|uniref:AAA+ ATPase domain-containing protein n=1 Tax=Saccharothrix violaceirubra TaxID=413306 RepID=A0A7W7T4S1_9PSEU|nr:DUF87 domain-containing protein [Saccharothrix violaceirubra]MBB4966583.1 hypothetical protein [Saccharothrix violaceirubra]